MVQIDNVAEVRLATEVESWPNGSQGEVERFIEVTWVREAQHKKGVNMTTKMSLEVGN